MLKRIFTLTIAGLLSCMLIGSLASVSDADYGNYADRLSREHRLANDVDEWIERGNATITASPLFEDGMRLTAWANNFQDKDKFEFAIASGVYLFEIPRGAQSIEIVVRYKGEPHTFEINDQYEPIAGRIWVRNIKRELTKRGYHDQSASETRYGDTFVLRAKNRSETIKIPVAGHVKDGWMELHVVAEGGEQLDVEYIEVSTYRRAPKLRVVQHYTPSYRWRPWNRYTYLYFYDGPVFYSTGYDSYLCWSYPVYDHRYLSIRTYYGGYLGRYRTYHPARYSYYYTPYHGGGYGYGYGRGHVVYSKRTQLNRWSAQHENARKQYSRSRLAVPPRTVERTQVNNNVRGVIENHRRQAPPSTERLSRSALISQKQRTATRSSLRTNEATRTYTSRSRYSNLNTDSTRRILYKTRSNVNTDRRGSSSVTGRSSNFFRRSITSSSSRSGSSSSSNSRLRTSNSSSSRTQRSSPAVTTTPTKTRSTSQSSSRVTSSNSSRTRSATTNRTRSSSSSSSSSSSDDDDADDKSRSRSSERIKRRR